MARLKLTLSMLIFGTVGVFVRNIGLPSSVIALVRGIVGTVFLLLFIAIRKKPLSRTAIRHNLLLLVCSGAAIGFNWILLFESYRYTSIATATLCYYLAPVFVMLLSPILLKERLTSIKGVCIAVALLGMVFVSGVLQGGVSGMKGIAFGVGAACLYASVILMNKFLRGMDAYDTTIVQLGCAALVLLPYTLLTENFAAMSIDITGGVLLAVVGIIHTGFAYCMYFGSMARLSGQTIALFSYVDPVVAIMISALFLNEPMDIWSGLGALMILGSTLCSEWFGNRKDT